MPVELKPGAVKEDHLDAPVTEIAAPKKLQRVLFATHSHPPSPPPDYFASEYLDENLSLDGKG